MTTSSPSQKDHIVEFARSKIAEKPLYLDTETTGLTKQDEIVEIAIIDHDGNEIFNRLVKPSRLIPKEAVAIHKITNEQVESEQAWPILWPRIRGVLYGRLIAAYNSPFDQRMMEQSHACYRIPWRENFKFLDILNLFSAYRGSNRYFKLEEAGRFFNISLPNAHRSLADALLTRAVLHCIAGLSY